MLLVRDFFVYVKFSNRDQISIGVDFFSAKIIYIVISYLYAKI